MVGFIAFETLVFWILDECPIGCEEQWNLGFVNGRLLVGFCENCR
jgi:hypothetical protein